jgi:allantoinase
MNHTKLPAHDRYPYSPIHRRVVYDWPNGRRLAVYVALNVEHYAFGEGMREELVAGGHQPDVLNYSWSDYGNRVAVWRLKALFDELSIPITLLINSAVYDHSPDVIAAFRSGGHEIAAHGRTNSEAQGTLSEGDERALILEVTEAIGSRETSRPAGWLGPWLSESAVTPDLLNEAGYRYLLDWCMDDQPIWLKTRRGRILAVPYPQELNDSSTVIGRRVGAADFADMIVDQFDEMLEQSIEQPLVFALALHTFIIGQPFRLRHLRRALRHIHSRAEDVWLTTAGRIAEHASALSEAEG